MTRSSNGTAVRTVVAQLLPVDGRRRSGAAPRLIEPRLQTAVSPSEVTSMISVHRLDRCTTLPSVPSAVWLQVRLAASLKVIQPLPVCARVRIIRAYSSRAGTCRTWRPSASACRYAASNASPHRSGSSGASVGVDQRPRLVGLDPAHELVRDPVGQVEVVGAAGVLAGVVAQLQELLDVRVPRLEVDARRALAPAALVHRGDRGVERAQQGDDAVGLAVGAPDQRAAGADPRARDADAAGELRQLRDLLVARVDRVEVVARGSRPGSTRTSGCAGCRS